MLRTVAPHENSMILNRFRPGSGNTGTPVYSVSSHIGASDLRNGERRQTKARVLVPHRRQASGPWGPGGSVDLRWCVVVGPCFLTVARRAVGALYDTPVEFKVVFKEPEPTRFPSVPVGFGTFKFERSNLVSQTRPRRR